MELILIIEYNWKKIINIALKSEMSQFIWNNFYFIFINKYLLWDGGSIVFQFYYLRE